jgi:type IX secretion system substrate protein
LRALHTYGLLLILTFSFVNAHAWSNGPPDGHAGNPPELNTCVSCHNTYDLNSGIGGVVITGIPTQYYPSTVYNIMVVIGNTGLEHWGYQLTALNSDNQPAGTFLPPNEFSILSENPYPELDYIGQSEAGVREGEPFGQWYFQWIAPPFGTGPVMLYSTGMGADGDGTSENDYVYSFDLQLDEVNIGTEQPMAFMLENFHDFGNVPVGNSRTWTERLYSIGSEPLEIDEWNWLQISDFTVISPQLPISLMAGDHVDITIEFEPEFTGSWSDSLDFNLPPSDGISGIYVRGRGSFALPPDPFHLLSPQDGNLVGGDSVRFTWEPSANPDSIDQTVIFDIEIDTESDFSSSVFYEVGTDTSIALSAEEFADAELYFWRAYARDTNTEGRYSEEVWAFVTDFTSVNENGSPAVADNPFLIHTWPNPFNERVSITFELPYPTYAEVEVLDVLGRRVAVLHSGPMDAGRQTLQWGGEYPSGLYLVRITDSNNQTALQKMVMVK